MAQAPPTYEVREGECPIWASEPFRVFFPLGIVAAVFGLALWPLHYAGWWPLYPAIQHPRILIFGFGAAFVFGFLGTAWPRFLGSEALGRSEVIGTALTWLLAQILYARGAISGGDLAMALVVTGFLLILARRLFAEGREWPPPGFALAFLSVAMGAAVLLAWSMGWGSQSVPWSHFLRLVAYQGFLLLPVLGVGSYLFARFFAVPVRTGAGRPAAKPEGRNRRTWVLFATAVTILVSFALEAWGSPRWGNGLRLVAFVAWGLLALPGIWRVRAPGTRPWALRCGLILIAAAFACRFLWPTPMFAFEHLLFLGGFTLVILLTADRVVIGHCDDPSRFPPRSPGWRWMTWLLFLTAATRATSDLVPSTRVSHHIYAAILLTAVLAIWGISHGARLMRRHSSGED
jgi:uncharacterized protein involved in response to NO